MSVDYENYQRRGSRSCIFSSIVSSKDIFLSETNVSYYLSMHLRVSLEEQNRKTEGSGKIAMVQRLCVPFSTSQLRDVSFKDYLSVIKTCNYIKTKYILNDCHYEINKKIMPSISDFALRSSFQYYFLSTAVQGTSKIAVNQCLSLINSSCSFCAVQVQVGR